MPVACFEKTLKLTPSAVTVAPSGALAPTPTAAELSDELVRFMFVTPCSPASLHVRYRTECFRR